MCVSVCPASAQKPIILGANYCRHYNNNTLQCCRRRFFGYHNNAALTVRKDVGRILLPSRVSWCGGIVKQVEYKREKITQI